MITEHIPSIVAMAICILLSAYFSATETAFSSLNKTRLKVLAEKGNKRARLAYDLAENYDKLISTILIGNNIVNIAVSSIATLVFVALMGNIGATVSTAVITVVVLIFGEITPKSIAKDHPEKFAMFSAPIIHLTMKLFTPLNFLFSQWKRLVSKLFRSKEDSKMSQEELLMLLEEVEQEGGLDQDEGELLRNAVEFGDLQAKDILTHRVDLEAIRVDATIQQIGEVFTQSRFSRLLVYEESLDRIVGILHQKDFYRGVGAYTGSIREIMTPPVFIYQTEKVDDLLHLLQAKKSHIAVVLDEYGGTLGIVTMEDILEELVGDIWDEHDEVEVAFHQLSDGIYRVDCAVTMDDFCDHFGIRCDSESVSLGGWIMEQMGRIPCQGDRLTWQDLEITVEQLEDHRIETVLVRIRQPQAAGEAPTKS